MQTLLDEIARNASMLCGNAGRLFHGRGQPELGWPFLNIDKLDRHLFVTCFSPEKREFCLEIVNRIRHELRYDVSNVWLQVRSGTSPQLELLEGKRPADPIQIVEHGLTYRLTVGAEQNIGFFFDSANLRLDLKTTSAGKRILNLFAYTCSYAVAAIAGGADRVVNIDLNRNALSVGRNNLRNNSLSTDNVIFKNLNILKSWNALARLGPFDTVIIDPPTDQGKSFKAARDYAKVVKHLQCFLAPEGRVIACHNDPRCTEDFLIEIFQEHSPHLTYHSRILPAPAFRTQTPECDLRILDFRSTSL